MTRSGSLNAFAAALCSFALGQYAAAQCAAVWSDDFSPPMQPFTPVSTASFHDGAGPALYIGCRAHEDFNVPQTNLVRWDGSTFTSFQLGVDGEISALGVFDDGTGPTLYAGGNFTRIDGNSAAAIARWDGAQWHRVGIGMTGAYWPAQVSALAVFDDGAGPALYAGGDFITADGKPANNIARWDGASWSALGEGTDNYIHALAVFDDGSGPALYAAGYFTHAGGVEANGVARWDGSSWTSLGAGLGYLHGNKTPLAQTLAVFDEGTGPALFVGGHFSLAGEGKAWNIARWNGATWSEVAGGTEGPVYSVSVLDDGNGPRLYVAGSFQKAGNVSVRGIASWDGDAWNSLLGGVYGTDGAGAVVTMGVLDRDDAPGPVLLACGAFEAAGDVIARDLAAWDGSAWSAPLPRNDIDGYIRAFAVHDDGRGQGTCLYAAGASLHVGKTYGIGRWDGSSWSMVGPGAGNVRALAVFDDGAGQGPFLYAGNDKPGLMRWNGFNWKNVGSGVDGTVNALTVFDDGSGPALYIGGRFLDAHNGMSSMTRWDGFDWDNACDTFTYYFGQAEVYALQVYDDGRGGGPALFAGGAFNRAGDLIVGHIARWDGSEWSGLNLGANGPIHAMTVHDPDGGGPKRPRLCVGGEFTQVGNHIVRGLASWDGAYWEPLGDLAGKYYPTVFALASFDRDAAGPQPATLYAGGNFNSVNGVTASAIARYDGVSWSEVDQGVAWTQYYQGSQPYVYGLAAVDVPHLGHSLFAGGFFDTAGGQVSFGIARYGCPPSPPCYPDLDTSGALDLFDFLAFVNLFNTADPVADCDQNGAHDLFDFLCFVNAFNAGC